jgi:acyl CoA:acetate/3-ketoacid CoA transferase alpha subunit
MPWVFGRHDFAPALYMRSEGEKYIFSPCLASDLAFMSARKAYDRYINAPMAQDSESAMGRFCLG